MELFDKNRVQQAALNMMSERTGLYTLTEVAKLLSVSRSTVNRLIRQGDLEVVRIGYRTVRVTAQAVDQFIESKSTRRTSNH